MRKSAAAVAVLLVSALIVPSQGIAAQQQDRRRRFVVVYADGASLASARAAVKAANATIVSENAKIGVATVETRNSNFVQAVENQSALVGAARNRPIGRAEPRLWVKPDIERLDLGAGVEAASSADRRGPEPLAHLQWDMRMIHATKKGSYREQRGDPGVMVGIIDTGIEGSHPDIERNFDEEMSRNFTVDIPLVDGPCADDPDGSCKDPADVDENGHGTHVAGTVAAPINGRGIAGVAPDVTLVNLRGGQDSGYFFLQPSVDALTYAGDAGVDVVNMSYFIDPWLFNCRGNPADSPAQQREQRTIITATQRALDYAHRRGVTLVSALGNAAIDLGRPKVDTISPDFPPGEEKERQISNSCLTLPTEGRHVIGVSALGPSERKSWYSNWGLEQTDVSAPGGDSVDILPEPRGRILAPYPRVALEAEGLLDPDGRPNTPAVLRECRNDRCYYYRYLQGTSMASPHAVGVAALIVSEFGESESDKGLTLDPDSVAARLESTATDHRCPPGRVQEYPELAELEGIVGPWEAYTAHCAGSRERNGFYGHGIVDALSAVADD
jgi:subtilisin family serine protease